MPVPRKKMSRARRNNRRSHQHLGLKQVQKCNRCGASKLSHCICPSCGFYKDVEVVHAEAAR